MWIKYSYRVRAHARTHKNTHALSNGPIHLITPRRARSPHPLNPTASHQKQERIIVEEKRYICLHHHTHQSPSLSIYNIYIPNGVFFDLRYYTVRAEVVISFKSLCLRQKLTIQRNNSLVRCIKYSYHVRANAQTHKHTNTRALSNGPIHSITPRQARSPR